MKIVAFMNQKGGVGKTTSAVNIGALLAEFGYKVLLIDLDPQGHLSDHLGVYPEDRSLYDVLVNDLPPECAVRSVYGLDILPANLDLSAAEIELVAMMNRETRLKKTVGNFCEKQNYDYVLLDCQPSLGLLPICGLTFAEHVVVPMEAEYLALKGLSQLANTIEMIRENLNPQVALNGVFFCMYSGVSTLAKNVKSEVEKFLPDKVFANCARRNVKIAEAPSHGKPVCVYDPFCAGTQDYRDITHEFIERFPVPKTASIAATVGDSSNDTGGNNRTAVKKKIISRKKNATPTTSATSATLPIDDKPSAKSADEKTVRRENSPTKIRSPKNAKKIKTAPKISKPLADSENQSIASIASAEANAAIPPEKLPTLATAKSESEIKKTPKFAMPIPNAGTAETFTIHEDDFQPDTVQSANPAADNYVANDAETSSPTTEKSPQVWRIPGGKPQIPAVRIPRWLD